MAVLKVYDGTKWVDVALSSHAVTHTDGSDDVQSATASQKGLATAAQITKLDGIESAATADQTAAEIKTAYESNTDTNEFDDAEQTKLAGIEALADVTDAVNVAAAGAAMLSEAETITNDWTFSADKKLLFRDAGIFLHSNADGELTIEADGKVNIPADTDLTGTLTVTGQLDVDAIRLNGSTIEPPTTGDLIVRGGTGGSDTVKFGRTGGDVVFGTTTSQDGVPNTDLMFDFGTTTKRFGHGFFGHGVRTKSKTTSVNFGAAPTNAQLDVAFGTEAVLGDGFLGVIEDDTGGTGEPWLCFVVNGKWAHLKGAFA